MPHLVWQESADVVVVTRADVVDAGQLGPNAQHFLVGGERNLARCVLATFEEVIGFGNDQIIGFEMMSG
jgi:hypothetical protein